MTTISSRPVATRTLIDPLFKTRPLFDASRSTYRQNYEPSGQLSVDESLQPFKGRLVYKQYIPSKPKKWGMKFWVLCDAETGFCLNWNQYVGHEGNGGVRESLSERVVKDLVEPYYGSERTIYMDNYYSSVPLYRHLADHDLGACGTVRPNRRGLPEDVRRGSLRLTSEDPPVFFTQGEELMVVTWQDTKRVNVMSTVHDNDVQEKRVRSRHHEGGHRTLLKPKVVSAYNKYMNGVDKLDQRVNNYRFPHKKVKAYRVTYHFVMDVALVNAYIAYRMAGPENKLTSRDFRAAVAKGLLQGHTIGRYRTPSPTVHDVARLEEKHFLGEFENRKHRPDYYVCSDRIGGKRKQTKTYCKQCQLAMCISCFELFHTKLDYRS